MYAHLNEKGKRQSGSDRIIHTHAYTYTCMCVCMYVCMYASMYVRSARCAASVRPQAKAHKNRSEPKRKGTELKRDYAHTNGHIYLIINGCMHAHLRGKGTRQLGSQQTIHTHVHIYTYV